MRDFKTISGYDIMGAGPEDLALVIKVQNIPELVAKQGGKVGAQVQRFLPGTIANTVYGEMKKKMTEGFAAEGVRASIDIVQASSAPSGPPPKAEFFIGLAAGGIGVAALGGTGWLIWKYVLKRFFFKG